MLYTSAYKMFQALTFLLVMGTMATADNHMASLAKANTQFGRNVLNGLAPRYDNIVFSPYSLHSALTMTSMGATGVTKEEMDKVLGLSAMDDDATNQAYMDLISSFDSTGEDVDVLTGNAIFQNPKFTIMQTFKDLVSTKYFAIAKQLNFSEPGMAENMINDYVEEKTKNMIKDLFTPGSLDKDLVKMVLVNTLFFNGTWKMPFKRFETEKADFHIGNDEKVKVDMMTMRGNFELKFRDDFNTLKLPFTGDRFSLYFVVSNATVGNDFMCLPERYPDQFFSEPEATEANIFVPKFEINFKSGLPPVLKKLGMMKAFQTSAEFSKISPNTMLSDVIHQAVIKVNEVGTTAAAATGVEISVNSAYIPMELPEFRVDRPFLFFLRDDTKKEILFQGKFSRPQEDPTRSVQAVQGSVASCDRSGASTASLAVIGWVVSVMCSLSVCINLVK